MTLSRVTKMIFSEGKNEKDNHINIGRLYSTVDNGCLEQAANSAVDLVNSLNTSDSPEVKSVKNRYLTSYSDKITVGKALDFFLGNPIWQYFESEDHQKVVQCNGTCQYNDKTVEAKIQFLLNDDDTFEIHAMALNDIDQNLLMMAAFMGKVYESAGVEDTWEDDSAEDELKGSASTSSSQIQK